LITGVTTDGHNGRWLRSRYGFVSFWFGFLLFTWLALRLVFFFAFVPSGLPSGQILNAFLNGFHRDIFTALIFTLPLLFWMTIVPERQFASRWNRILVLGTVFISCYVQIFLLFVSFFFFEEFKSRFNTVAVDYLIYPQEVFVNIWESYHVGVILVVCFLVSAGWLLLASWLFRGMWQRAYPLKSRALYLFGALAIAIVLVPTIRFKGVRVGTDRTLNEVANSDGVSFIAAALTRHLDYAAFYKTLPREDAWSRVHRLLLERDPSLLTANSRAPSQEGRGPNNPTFSIQRKISGDARRPRLNIVLLLEESLGSEFWGCLGAIPSWTPEMDKLALQEGLLFTNLYANGNRTVRGMEGVLSSFPSLPGDSIVKRDRSDNVETIARVLKRDGYSSLFVYGGRGLFDGMRSFTTRNGYDRFVEQKHFEHPTYTTAWGVCDEDIFNRMIEELRSLDQSGKPFFATVLSVSNHKPYTYPKGRIPEDPDQHLRNHAVKYSDYCLGRFFDAARKEAFWTNTIFAVVADHGARVYGKQSIPIHSYEIPLVILGPAAVTSPSRNGQLGCSLDVSPTLLGLLGRPYDSMFFGRDLLKMNPEDGRVLLNHNRDIGRLAHDRLVVLGLMQSVEFYQGDPKRVDMTLLPNPTEADRELEKDAIAIYQVADELYTQQRYHIDPR
jgi:phosphoglycerol transferase MdoB-like AlkP superfamily enzyme